jgi:hypothetical protein
MKLKYAKTPESEGGGAVPDCGTIHRSEIKSTLTQLSDELEFPFDLNDFVVGSTGKSEYSGDIDVVLDDKWWGHGSLALKQQLIEMFGEERVARNGSMVHLAYPISNYDESFNERKPRTGIVQVDFNFGNYEWEKFYHYSPGDTSEYKGAHRNLVIGAICGSVNTVNSEELDTYNRPITQERWKYSTAGFSRVLRKSKKDERSGVWMKKQDDTILDGPHFDPNFIIKTLFPVSSSNNCMHSMETLLSNIKQNYSIEDQELVFKRIANNFGDWKGGEIFLYPTEISKHFNTK